jgi:hypothetical protein
MIILIDKQAKMGYIHKDMVAISRIIQVHPITIKRRLPFWESERYVLCTGEPQKSARGRNNLPKK